MDFDDLLNLAICFGTAEQRQEVARIDKRCHWSDWRLPDQKPEDSPDAAMVTYMEILKRYAAGEALDQEGCRLCLHFCESPKAPKRAVVEVRPRLEALIALDRGDAATWNAHLARVIAPHKNEALRGEFKLLPQAFICLSALALAQLGREWGLTCTVDSPYLPLQLLETKG